MLGWSVLFLKTTLISQVEHAQTIHEYQSTMNQTKRPEIKAIVILHLKQLLKHYRFIR